MPASLFPRGNREDRWLGSHGNPGRLRLRRREILRVLHRRHPCPCTGGHGGVHGPGGDLGGVPPAAAPCPRPCRISSGGSSASGCPAPAMSTPRPRTLRSTPRTTFTTRSGCPLCPKNDRRRGGGALKRSASSVYSASIVVLFPLSCQKGQRDRHRQSVCRRCREPDAVQVPDQGQDQHRQTFKYQRPQEGD